MKGVARFGPDVLMVGGAGGALAGLYLLAGLGWCVLVGGVLVAGAGFLLEMGWHSDGH